MQRTVDVDPKDIGIIYQDWSESDKWAALAGSGDNQAAISEIETRIAHSAPQLRRRFGRIALGAPEQNASSAEAS